MIYHLLGSLKVVVDYFSAFVAGEDFGTDVSRSANRWSISQDLSCFLDRVNYLFLLRCGRFSSLHANASKSASADQSCRPGAEVLRSETRAHHLFDVLIYVSSLNMDETALIVLIFEYFRRTMPQQLANDSGRRSISQLCVLNYLRLSGKIEFDNVASHADVFWPKGR